jgi:uncharacterized protein (TIGR03083 family)
VSRATFLAAADVVADAVDRIPPTAWDGPGLGVWDLRALVGHTSRSLVTVVEYLAQPADAVDVATPEAYYVVVARLAGADPAAVVERGRAAGAALGDDPAAGFRARRDAAAAVLEHAGDEDLLTTLAGGMRLAAYLPTRTFELAVHGADIASATGIPVAFPPPVLVESVTLAARIAVQRGDGPGVLAALTGRAALPPGFSVV